MKGQNITAKKESTRKTQMGFISMESIEQS